jgi:hypothetical protein
VHGLALRRACLHDGETLMSFPIKACQVQAIENLDADILHADLLPQLICAIPSKEDIDAVRAACDVHGGYEEVKSRLGAAETFYMELHRIKRVHAKINVLQFKQDFVEKTDDCTVCMLLIPLVLSPGDMNAARCCDFECCRESARCVV